MIENKKFAKQLKTIISSSEEAKKIAEAELQKIDEKYKALAEQEKRSIRQQIDMLDKVISSFAQTNEAEPVVEETPVAPEAEAPAEIVDTLFPENNEQESTESEEFAPAEEPVAEMPEEKESPVEVSQSEEAEEDDSLSFAGDNDDPDWDYPEEWKD